MKEGVVRSEGYKDKEESIYTSVDQFMIKVFREAGGTPF